MSEAKLRAALKWIIDPPTAAEWNYAAIRNIAIKALYEPVSERAMECPFCHAKWLRAPETVSEVQK